ncbi:hypothetical protein GLOIN_2v1773465 [Rhizophagus irregularis DAOM 181602=DAOM 197198]|nr:hypothetical protein GLOIN_2v1773465 [Rhizophagus irregularis DAOM 181602=DAOM 197198]
MSNMGDSVENYSEHPEADFLEFVSEEGKRSYPIQHFSLDTLYASFRSWNNFATRAYIRFGDMGDSESECPSTDDEFGSTFLSIPKTTPKPVHVTPPILPDVKMTPVDQTVTPETSWKKDKQRAKPEAQTPDKQNTLFLGAKTSTPGLHIY